MPPQSSEHHVVALLRQCFVSPLCRGRCIGKADLSASPAVYNKSSVQRQPRRASAVPGRRYMHYKSNCRSTRNVVLGAKPISLLLAAGSAGSNLSKAFYLNPPQRAQYSSSSQAPQNIAVLGGGITGLTAAHYLMRELPQAKITLYEAGPTLGGWLKSKRVGVEDGKYILFEQGPRSLRSSSPAGHVTIDMIAYLLKHNFLANEFISSHSNSLAAQNRFVYYPDHLVRMPGPGRKFYEQLWSVMSEPVFKGVLSGFWKEVTQQRSSFDAEDESVGAFLERILGSAAPGSNVASAVLHGIYGGDIYQLSARTLMPSLWRAQQQPGSIMLDAVSRMLQKRSWEQSRDVELMSNIIPKLYAAREQLLFLQGSSVYTFKGGLGSLANGVESSLASNPNVKLEMNTAISALEFDSDSQKINVTTKLGHPPRPFDNVISTISSQAVSKLTPHLPTLSDIHSVTVMVVNLFYSDPNLLPERGFGYLLPRSLPFEQNPERALGVVFDSDATPGQDDMPGTKLTVMLGGHWWDGFSSHPDEEEGLSMARAILKRHLGVEAEPLVSNVSLQRDAIPQYTVGHHSRMRTAHDELLTAFNGKLAVAGNSYTGVGVNDCVRAAWDLANDLSSWNNVTGLEQFVGETKWVNLGQS